MFYYLKNNFVEVTEPAGIIQNLSPYTIEVSTTNTENSGNLLLPNQTYFFKSSPIYMRCIDGTAKTRVITAGNNYCCCDANLLCSSCDGSGDGSGGGSGSGSGGGISRGSAAIISDFTGATSITGGASGLVPAPQAGDNDKFLRGDGQWVTLSSGESYSEATTLTSGLMPATDKAKLDNLSDYTLPTANTSTKGGVIIGDGLSMNGDTLNCTVGGGVILSTVASAVNGAMWLTV